MTLLELPPVSATRLIMVLLRNRIHFIGTIAEMTARLDQDIQVGQIYFFHCHIRQGRVFSCGLVGGRLVRKVKNAHDELVHYELSVTSTNTSTNAPKFQDICIVKNPAELYLNGKFVV